MGVLILLNLKHAKIFVECISKSLTNSSFLVFLMILLFMGSTYHTKPVIEYSYVSTKDSHQSFDIFLVSLVALYFFFQGNFYSNIRRQSKDIVYSGFSLHVIFGLSFILFKHGFGGNYDLDLSVLAVLALPYSVIAFLKSPPSAIRTIGLIFIFIYFSIGFSSRNAFLATVVFWLVFFIYPFVVRNAYIYYITFLSIFLSAFLLSAIYIFFPLDTLSQISEAVFGKPLDTGRIGIWVELSERIIQEPLTGWGVGQASQYFYATSPPFRSLSSHNTYLELLLRGGVILLVGFCLMLFLIWASLRSISLSIFGRVGASFLASLMYLMVGGQYLFGINIIYVAFCWFFLGLAVGHVVINRKQASA